MKQQSKSTRAEEIYRQVRARLLRGELTPGTKLKISEISAEFDVSLSVVREAVTRLAEQGLVQANPQRGFSVMPLSIEDLTDLTRARVLIETLALRESIAQGDLAWEAGLLAAHHTLRRTPMLTPEGHVNPGFAEIHRAFHGSLLAGCRSSRLKSVAMALRDCSELYMHWAQELGGDEDRDVACEHQHITDLTLARDAKGAAQALAEHIERTTASLIQFAQTQSGLGTRYCASA